MTPTKQQDEMWIDVLEWMGWEIPDDCSHKSKSRGAPPPFGKRPGTDNDWTSLPPLTLDTLHEAERKFLKTATLDQLSFWLDELYRANGLNPFVWRNAYGSQSTPSPQMAQIVSSNAQQRLLALWRTIRKPDQTSRDCS
jgi:hypothetical protein